MTPTQEFLDTLKREIASATATLVERHNHAVDLYYFGTPEQSAIAAAYLRGERETPE